jgi:hypothetical protein
MAHFSSGLTAFPAPFPMPEPAHDALEALRARLEETRAYAERLADGAAAARAGAESAADAGEESGPAGDGRPTPAGDLEALVALLEALRELVPPELQQQLADVTRQVLLLIRALIDWWVQRLDPAPGAPAGGGPPATGSSARRPHDIPVS